MIKSPQSGVIEAGQSFCYTKKYQKERQLVQVSRTESCGRGLGCVTSLRWCFKQSFSKAKLVLA
jgi:hypothetical protein